ncbi:MAG: ASKHA domain-containing protein [Deltaproteobacteria bacterium]|nr:ASKHA domain-containing protein [Deltaproteobacteria bacterium]
MTSDTITVRHRTAWNSELPAFSARSFRELAGGSVAGPSAPAGFADTQIPVSGTTLAQCVYLSGVFAPPALCSGLGRCGLCRVRFLSAPPPVLDGEKAILSHHDLEAGWRLACRHAPQAGARILIPALPVKPVAASPDAAPPGGTPFGLAVDLGTTSIHWRLVDPGGADAARNLPRGMMTNPQMGAGSDVVSRIAYAAHGEGAAKLHRLVTDSLVRVVATCEAEGRRVAALCVAANPAMTAIFLGRDTRSLAAAPYSLPCAGNMTVTVAGLPPAYVPPQLSPFVGGDSSAGYAALALDPDLPPPEYPFLLADLGTNGECLLALSPAEALAASLPMGPALEGVNLAYGSAAVPGAVTAYALTPGGLEPSVMGGTAPTGITATGYLSLLRILRLSGIISEDGLFTRGGADRLRERIGEGDQGGPERSIRLPGRMALYASDVEEILKVKAAFSLAVSSLLEAASLPAAKLSRIYLAGSLGMNAPVNALTALGFVPPGVDARITAAGNTSLAGAALFLRRGNVRAACARWAGGVSTLDLASDPAFGEAFARHMTFTWR